MARLSVEDVWFTDVRRFELAKRVGSEELADGIMIGVWRLAQEFWKHGRKRIPLVVFQKNPHWKILMECDLAVQNKNLIYIRGAKRCLDWLSDRIELARKGGKLSGISRKQTRSKREANGEANANPLSLSPSSSLSSSLTKKEEEEYAENKKSNPKGENLLPQVGAQALPQIKKRERYSEETRMKMKTFFARYAEKYKEKYGCNPQSISDPAIRGKVGNWIEGISEERASNLVEVYLQVDYKPINESQHDLWKFFFNLNRVGNCLDSGRDIGGINWAKVFGDQTA